MTALNSHIFCFVVGSIWIFNVQFYLFISTFLSVSWVNNSFLFLFCLVSVLVFILHNSTNPSTCLQYDYTCETLLRNLRRAFGLYVFFLSNLCCTFRFTLYFSNCRSKRAKDSIWLHGASFSSLWFIALLCSYVCICPFIFVMAEIDRNRFKFNGEP